MSGNVSHESDKFLHSLGVFCFFCCCFVFCNFYPRSSCLTWLNPSASHVAHGRGRRGRNRRKVSSSPLCRISYKWGNVFRATHSFLDSLLFRSCNHCCISDVWHHRTAAGMRRITDPLGNGPGPTLFTRTPVCVPRTFGSMFVSNIRQRWQVTLQTNQSWTEGSVI